MRLHYFAVLLAAVPLHAGTIDVTALEMARLRAGDRLSFELFVWNYAQNARTFGIAPDPDEFSFAFATSPTNSHGTLSATLSSPDASISVRVDEISGFTAGYLS